METYRVANNDELEDMASNLSEDFSVTSTENNEIDVYPACELPMPFGIEEKENEVIFLEPGIGEGKRMLGDKSTTVPQLFALLRQFVSPVCENIGLIVDEMLRRGVGINSIDSATGLTMLHYAIQACALSGKHAFTVVKKLLRDGADSNQRGTYSGMNALHLAAYFDLAPVVTLLLDNKYSVVHIESLCPTFEYGTALHIAATCLSYSTVQILLQNAASSTTCDDVGRIPEHCVPDQLSNDEEVTKADGIKNLLQHFSPAAKKVSAYRAYLGTTVSFSLPRKEEGNTTDLKKMTGILRYVGALPSSSIEWAGIELDSPHGKNNGALEGHVYFRCKPDHGIFVPTSNITIPALEGSRQSSRRSSSRGRTKKSENHDFKIGDKVSLANSKTGIIRFIGKTKFASGTWCGIELDDGNTGKSDGSIDGVRYFRCKEDKGIFALPSMIYHWKSNEVETKNIETISLSNLSLKSEQSQRLKPGLHVQIIGMKKNKSAIVRFVGETRFAEGTWVGLELPEASGRNDGSVQGCRYFTCPPKHGIMLRPSSVSYRGVNGEDLL